MIENSFEKPFVANNEINSNISFGVTGSNVGDESSRPAIVMESGFEVVFLDWLKQQGGVIEDEPSIDANQLYQDLTDPDKRPIWLYDALALDPNRDLPPVPMWCKIGGRDSLPVQGIITFLAKQKNGKSLSTYAFTIPLITGKIFNNVTPISKPKLVLVFDLEMGENTLLQRNKLHRQNLGGSNRFVVFPLLKFDARKRAEIILQKVEEYHPDIVIVDQVAKLMSNINDPTEATRVTRLLEVVGSRCSCWCVIHENKGADTNARGHIGQELAIASEETYRVWKKGGVFHIHGVEARGKDMEEMEEVCFCYDEINGIQDASKVVRIQEDTKVRNQNIELLELFTDIFKNYPQGMTPGDIVKEINQRRKKNKQPIWTSETIRQKRDIAVVMGILMKKADPNNTRKDRNIFLLNEDTNHSLQDICFGVADCVGEG